MPRSRHRSGSGRNSWFRFRRRKSVVKPSELDAVLAGTAAEARKHSAAFPELLVTSSESKAGIEALRTAVLTDAGI